MGGCNIASIGVAAQGYLHSCEELFLVRQIGQTGPVCFGEKDLSFISNRNMIILVSKQTHHMIILVLKLKNHTFSINSNNQFVLWLTLDLLKRAS